MLLNQELRTGGHKIVHAGYVSDICPILVLYNVGPYDWGRRRLCILNQSLCMCDLLLPTGFKGSNVITSHKCDNVLRFMMRVLGNWLWRIYHCYSTRTWILINHPFCLLYFIPIDVSFVFIVADINFNKAPLLSFIFYFYLCSKYT